MGLAATVEMHDIGDVESYVRKAIHSLGLTLSFTDREDLEADGFEMMCELNQRYTPMHDRRGYSFSSYCWTRLRGRVIDRHHQAHRGEHVKVRNGEGRTVWEYRSPIVSFEDVTASPTFDEARVATITRFQRPARAPALAAA